MSTLVLIRFNNNNNNSSLFVSSFLTLVDFVAQIGLKLILFQDCSMKFSLSESCGFKPVLTHSVWLSYQKQLQTLPRCGSGDITGIFSSIGTLPSERNLPPSNLFKVENLLVSSCI